MSDDNIRDLITNKLYVFGFVFNFAALFDLTKASPIKWNVWNEFLSISEPLMESLSQELD